MAKDYRPYFTSDIPNSATVGIVEIPEGGKPFIVCGDYTGAWVHWLGKRSAPCLGDNCPASRHSKPAYWYAYYPVLEPGPHDEAGKALWLPGILAVNREVAKQINEYRVEHDGPCLVTLRRKPQRREVIVSEIRGLRKGMGTIPAIDVVGSLYRVWAMLPPALPETQTTTEGGTTEDV